MQAQTAFLFSDLPACLFAIIEICFVIFARSANRIARDNDSRKGNTASGIVRSYEPRPVDYERFGDENETVIESAGAEKRCYRLHLRARGSETQPLATSCKGFSEPA